MIFLSMFKRKKEENNKNNLSKNDWPESVVILNEKNFIEFIEKYPFAIVDFWAAWCAPCKTMNPRLRLLSKTYKGKVAFGKVDSQKHEKLAKKYKIYGIPNLIFFKNGKNILSINGVRSIGSLKDTIDDLLK